LIQQYQDLPHQIGVPETPSALDPAIPVITEPLRQNGYHTAWIGKWHLDGSNSASHIVPVERRGGFDYWLGYENNNNQYESWVYGTDQENPIRLEGYETDALTDLLINHVEKHVDKNPTHNRSEDNKEEYQPFFATLSVQPPHSPYVPPMDNGDKRYFKHPEKIQLKHNVPHSKWARHKAKQDLAGYYGMIENIDMNVGRIRQSLKKLGIDRETYLVFFSDHGDCLGSHGQWAKSSPWEESIKIPFIVSTVGGSAHMQTGRDDSLINHVDIAPTTLGLCGITPPSWMKGYDYSSSIVKHDRPEYLGSNPHPAPGSAYLQQIPRKYHSHSVNQKWRGVITKDRWKYICVEGKEWLLFDLNDDPFETANLVFDTVFQKQKESCHQLLEEWISITGDDFALPDIRL